MQTTTRTPANIASLKPGKFYVIDGQVLRYSKCDFMKRYNFTHIVDNDMVVVKFVAHQLTEIYNF
jgi:hypothetical protein